jgi:hypothetical protein
MQLDDTWALDDFRASPAVPLYSTSNIMILEIPHDQFQVYGKECFSSPPIIHPNKLSFYFSIIHHSSNNSNWNCMAVAMFKSQCHPNNLSHFKSTNFKLKLKRYGSSSVLTKWLYGSSSALTNRLAKKHCKAVAVFTWTRAHTPQIQIQT